MKLQKPTARSIDLRAAEWVARRDTQKMTPEEEAEFQAWLDSDARCLGAFARAQAMYLVPQVVEAKARTQGLRLPKVDGGALSRRAFLAAAASLVGGIAFVFSRRTPDASKVYESVLGEIRSIPLDDGSKITLNTNSAVTVDFRKDVRLVRLMRGEAYFEVAKAADRPFIVMGPVAQVRTVGTAYSVRLAEAPTKGKTMKVQVTSGQIAVESAPSALAQSVMALTGRWSRSGKNDIFVNAQQEALIRFADAASSGGNVLVSVESVTADAFDRALAWRQQRLAFEGETLAQAAAEFARYSSRRIVIDDTHLANEHISGLFATNDPEGFSRAVALGLGAKLRTESDTIVLYR